MNAMREPAEIIEVFVAGGGGFEPTTFGSGERRYSSQSRVVECPESTLFHEMWRTALVVVAIAGSSACVAPWQPEGNAPPERVAAALERWTDRGLPAGDCADAAISIHVGLTPEELDRECGLGRLGCVVYGVGQVNGAQGWDILVGTSAPLEVLIEHEFRHVLAACSGLHPDMDIDHRDPVVWFEPMDDTGEYEYEGFER